MHTIPTSRIAALTVVMILTTTPLALADPDLSRNGLPEPGLIRQATWRESLIASREALLRWEREQDRLAMQNVPATLGPWHVLGPLPAGSQTVKQLDSQTRIDLAARHEGKDGRPIAWQRRDDFEDGKLVDLTEFPGAESGDVVYLCRNVTLEGPLPNNQLPVGLAMSNGTLRWLPKNERFNEARPVAPNNRNWRLSGPAGEHQLVARLGTGRDARRQFYFMPQPNALEPGAGDGNRRIARRRSLFEAVRREFTTMIDAAEIEIEQASGFWDNRRELKDWPPEEADAFLAAEYTAAIRKQLTALAEKSSPTEAIHPALETWIRGFEQELAAQPEAGSLPAKLYLAAAVERSFTLAARIPTIRLAVNDQRDTWGSEYPVADKHLARLAGMEQQIRELRERLLNRADSASLAQLAALGKEIEQASSEMLLANPVLDFDKLLLVKGPSSFNSNWGGPNRLGNEMVVLSPVRPDGELTTIHRGNLSDIDLHWDAERILFSDGSRVWEIRTDGTELRQVTTADTDATHYDACYLPNGQIVCVSNACEQAVPCTGGANVGNMHLLNADGSGERRLTYDQDHNWNPVVMQDGRVLYTRWEYTESPHYFTRLLFRMNPDGTNQKEYYGSNSYWPNAMYWPRPIPGHPTMISCVVSGHHGVSRVGELLLLDPARGRHEAEGAVQRIPGYGKKVEAITRDGLVSDTWPRFAAPWPLAEPGTNRGAGKYFLACVKRHEWSAWDVCLVDVFDNITPILTGDYMTPIPLRPRPKPPIVPSRIDPEQKEAIVYLADVYQGPGLKGFPRGTIQRLRVGSHHYRFAGNGDTSASSMQGGWDVKKILGTVPVHEDGSAMFRVPANTPIFVQPLDAEGKSQQVMRSWFTAMPGEFLSCVGCHEKQNDGPPSKYNMAAHGRRPDAIQPWFGPVRGFSFDREVQPVLDRRCVGCHDGSPDKHGDDSIVTLDLRAKRLHPDYQGNYSPAYVALQRYVRRPGFESDYHMPKPAEYEAETSALVQLLKKNHYNVQLTADEWERLYTWIDFNVPYPLNWRESHRPPQDSQVERRVRYKRLHANIDDCDEAAVPLPPIAPFEPPEPSPQKPTTALKLAGWPLTVDQAQAMQQAAGPVEQVLDLGEDVSMPFVLVPAGKFVMGDIRGLGDEHRQAVVTIPQAFYMSRFEVTAAQYARFDATHDNGVINERGKDRSKRGTPINAPNLPVVRISWQRAMAFCEWLAAESGRRCTLPTEAEWEWACRAGTDTPFATGDPASANQPQGNLADRTAQSWNHGRAEPGYNDGVAFTAPGGRYPANAWGLCDMHGNVAEWCLSTFKPYPYNASDGRDDPAAAGLKVVRGGSWNDTARHATSAARWRYEPYKPVYNVGFRVVFPAPPQAVVTAARDKRALD